MGLRSIPVAFALRCDCYATVWRDLNLGWTYSTQNELAFLSSLYAATRRPGYVVLRKLLSGPSCQLRATSKIGEFTGDSILLPTFRTLLAEAGKAGARDGWRPRPRGSSDCVVTAARQARYIPGGIWETSRRVDRTERVLAEPAKAKIGQRTLLRLQQLRYAHAPLGVMRPRMQLSFLSNCDDVSLPALKLDPDTEIARVVPADVEVRQRAVLHDVECSCDDRF